MIIIINNDVPETHMTQDMNRAFQQVVPLLPIKQIISICAMKSAYIALNYCH